MSFFGIRIRTKIDRAGVGSLGGHRMAVIYRIRNRITGKCYIGETKEANPETRWRQHCSNFRCNRGCPALRDAVQKHGIEAFEFQILIFCFDDDRFKYEIEYIAKFNTQVPNGYNITKGGEGGAAFTGRKHTAETIAKIKQNLRKHYENPEYIRRLSESVKNAMASPEVRKKVSENLRNSEKFRKAVEEGRVGKGILEYTPEIRSKISESLKKHFEKNGPNQINVEKHRSAMAKAKGVSIYQYSTDGKFVASHESIKSASRSLSVQDGALRRALKDSKFTCKGYVWKTTPPNVIEHT